MQKNKAGFTLVELIIVIVIVGILSIVAVPIYRGYTLKSKMTEGKSLTGSIITAQRVYYAELGKWYQLADWVEEDEILGMNAKQNMYFKKAKTGISSLYPNTISAETFSETENLILYQFWPFDMSQEADYPKWLVTDSAGNVVLEER